MQFKTLEGEINAVDVPNRSLMLEEKQKIKIVAIDDQTKISALGKVVQSSSLSSGEKVSIKYVDENGKLLGKRIYLYESRHASRHYDTKNNVASLGRLLALPGVYPEIR